MTKLFTGIGRSVWEKTVPFVLGTALAFGFEPYSRLQAQWIAIRTSSGPTKLIFTIKDILEMFLTLIAACPFILEGHINQKSP